MTDRQREKGGGERHTETERVSDRQTEREGKIINERERLTSDRRSIAKQSVAKREGNFTICVVWLVKIGFGKTEIGQN